MGSEGEGGSVGSEREGDGVREVECGRWYERCNQRLRCGERDEVEKECGR